jgi:hypothetical protein
MFNIQGKWETKDGKILIFPEIFGARKQSLSLCAQRTVQYTWGHLHKRISSESHYMPSTCLCVKVSWDCLKDTYLACWDRLYKKVIKVNYS